MVVQFVHGVGGVVVGGGLGDPVPEEAEQGWSKSPEAMSTQTKFLLTTSKA